MLFNSCAYYLLITALGEKELNAFEFQVFLLIRSITTALWERCFETIPNLKYFRSSSIFCETKSGQSPCKALTQPIRINIPTATSLNGGLQIPPTFIYQIFLRALRVLCGRQVFPPMRKKIASGLIDQGSSVITENYIYILCVPSCP